MTWQFVRPAVDTNRPEPSSFILAAPPQVRSRSRWAAAGSKTTNADVLRQARAPASAYRCPLDEAGYRPRLISARPVMKTKSSDRRTPRRSRSLTRGASLCLLLAIARPVPSFSQGTPEQRAACTPDAFRLCSAFIPNADEIAACLRERSNELSDACRTALEAGTEQIPDGIGAAETLRKTKGSRCLLTNSSLCW
jgi:hypothetical protein